MKCLTFPGSLNQWYIFSIARRLSILPIKREWDIYKPGLYNTMLSRLIVQCFRNCDAFLEFKWTKGARE